MGKEDTFKAQAGLQGMGIRLLRRGNLGRERPHVRDHAPHLGGPRLRAAWATLYSAGSGALPIAGRWDRSLCDMPDTALSSQSSVPAWRDAPGPEWTPCGPQSPLLPFGVPSGPPPHSTSLLLSPVHDPTPVPGRRPDKQMVPTGWCGFSFMR